MKDPRTIGTVPLGEILQMKAKHEYTHYEPKLRDYCLQCDRSYYKTHHTQHFCSEKCSEVWVLEQEERRRVRLEQELRELKEELQEARVENLSLQRVIIRLMADES
jgi:predicted nucleic acid-binding Zn ribbon protein